MVNTVTVTQRNFIARKPATAFVLLWTVLNLVQISLTELTSDEGYYWFWSQHLQWGYYDHPPMVAVLIKLGSLLFPGELGVRLLNALCSTVSVWLFLSLLPDSLKEKRSTYIVLLSAPLLHYLGMLIFPDGPLLLFSMLFLVTYKRFLNQQNAFTSLLLGFALAGMAYAKYHGALVLLFTLIANPRLLRSVYFWLAISVAAALFLPHLWWQYQHQFPTFRYHLSGRQSQWSFRYVGEYLSQQLVAIGPGLIFVPFVAKATDKFERTLKTIIVGTFSFFLISSFKTFVHFHWTSIALFPLLYFAVIYYENPMHTKWLQIFLLPFVVLLFAARLLLVIPLIPAMHASEDYYHGRKEWAQQIAAVAGNRPVFTSNNLRETPLYSFYSGKLGVTLYNRPEKKSQYELWGYEDSLQGKEVLFLAKDSFPSSSKLATALDKDFYYSIIPSFHSYYNGIDIKVENYFVQNDSLHASLILTNQRPSTLQLATDSSLVLIAVVERGKEIVLADEIGKLNGTLVAAQSFQRKIALLIKSLSAGEYKLSFRIRNGVLPDAILSEATNLNF